jgi:transposase
MNDPQTVHIGVDVSKDSLRLNGETLIDGGILNKALPIRSTLKNLQKKVGEGKILHICLEATGPYGELLANECHKLGIRVSVLNPAKVRHYAKAISETAKTDPIDARVIRLFAQTKEPQPTLPPSEAQVTLRKLVLTREALSKSVTQLCGTLESVEGSEAGKILKQAIESLRKKIDKLEKHIKETATKDDHISGLIAALAQIEGVGELTAAKIVALVPEIGTLGKRRAAAITGLAPYTRDSGRFKGKTFISGGRTQVRCALFMPATVARTHNPVLKAVYKKMRENGKPYKVAMTAIMRRLFCYMDSVAAKFLAQQNSVAQATPSTTP